MVYYFIPRVTALSLIIPVAAVFITLDIARFYSTGVREWFHSAFGHLLRKHETDHENKRLNGASYLLISAIICILIFPKIITVTSFSILIISDLSAALIGKRFGKRRFLGKTLEGSLGFFISSVIVVALTPKIEYHLGEYLIGIAGAFIGTVVEASPMDVDDNLSVPLSVGAVMWILYLWTMPTLNIYNIM